MGTIITLTMEGAVQLRATRISHCGQALIRYRMPRTVYPEAMQETKAQLEAQQAKLRETKPEDFVTHAFEGTPSRGSVLRVLGFNPNRPATDRFLKEVQHVS
jgi:hypothetical protein